MGNHFHCIALHCIQELLLGEFGVSYNLYDNVSYNLYDINNILEIINYNTYRLYLFE